MEKNYVYIRDENGKIIGRTFGPSYIGDQHVVSSGEEKRSPNPFPGRSAMEQRFPALSLLAKWLLEDVQGAFLEYSRQGAWTGIAAAFLALLMAAAAFFDALTSSLLYLLPGIAQGLVILGLGAGLLLQKRTLTVCLFYTYSILTVLSLLISMLQFVGIPGLELLMFSLALRFLLDISANLSLAWLTKNCHLLENQSRLWLLPAGLELLHCILFVRQGIPVLALIRLVFAVLAARWVITCYRDRL